MDHRLEYFEAFVGRIAAMLEHADRREPFAQYCTGLLLPGERKSVEPMAAQVAPDRVRSKHQSLHHFVADAPRCSERCVNTCSSGFGVVAVRRKRC